MPKYIITILNKNKGRERIVNNQIAILLNQAKGYIGAVDEMLMEQQVAIKTRERLENSILEMTRGIEGNKEVLDITTHAIEILRQVSDEAVEQAYKFLEKSLNAALERMFVHTTRKIRLKEYTLRGQYPQLELELTVANGKVRSLKADSGHGLAQIVSLLSILSLIVITNSRRLLVMDEIISGVSVHNRKIVDDILWTFTGIGFQFIVNEHGFIPKGSKVYHLEMVGDVSHIKEVYTEENGIYLQGVVGEQALTNQTATEDTVADKTAKKETEALGGVSHGDNVVSI